MNEGLILNTIYLWSIYLIYDFFFFLLHKGAIASDFKAANMLPKTDEAFKNFDEKFR